MKLTEPYDRRLANYEGAVHVDTGGSFQAEGYFEAVQAFNGTIAIGCFFNEVVHMPTGIVNLTVEAVDKGGWKLRTEGQIVVPSLNISAVHGTPMTTVIIKPAYLRAMRMPGHNLSYLGTRFVVANLLLDQSSTTTPNPVCLSLEGRNVEIHPSKAYPEQVKQLKAIPGIEITALIDIKTSNGVRHSLDEDAKLIDNLISVLRLWSGNKLDWIYGEGLDDSFDNPVEVLHKNPVVGNFSNTFLSLGWQIDLRELVQAFFSTGDKPLDLQTIKEFINYFVDCCAVGPYFEIKALSAATLLDALTLKYAVAIGKETILEEADFKSEVLPKLKEAIDSISFEEAVKGDVKDQLKDNLQGLYRTSFRQHLKLVNSELSLQMNSKLIDRVKRTRDKLVHEGRFSSKSTTREDRWADYSCLLWTDFSALCRLVGYNGKLPP